ncbi:MAG: acetyltransferase [Gemmatimonadetes bacterium]|nr:acetyltransferase [Gemmatimonadota bacterium]
MPFLPLRSVGIPSETSAVYSEWLAWLSEELDSEQCDRNELCQRILTNIYFPHLSDAQIQNDDTHFLPVALAQMNPENVTLEPEYYQDIDLERYTPRKPLLWLWEMFDRSYLGENVELGIRFRRILAGHIFGRCGANFKAFPHVRLSFGYNLDVGDNVVIHRHVLLDDRGGIEIGDGSSVSDFANVYSHTHDIADGRIVETPKTVIGRGARITYHATILAGVHVADDSMVGAGAILTKSTEPHCVYAGIPAKKVKKKPDQDSSQPAPPTLDALADEI